MNKGMLVALAAIALLCAAAWSYGDSPWPPAGSATGAPGNRARGLITHHLPGGPTGDHLVVIDPATQVLAVYRVQRERGEIKLVSVRQMQWDLQLLSYNGEGPSPEEIRAGLERQRFD